MHIRPTAARITFAFIIAGIADVLQLPLNLAFASGLLAVPAEIAIIIVDVIAFTATTFLLGFHWLLIPSALVEFFPGIDLLPTWLACVSAVVWSTRIRSASELTVLPEAPPFLPAEPAHHPKLPTE
jgi:hypothetical protein